MFADVTSFDTQMSLRVFNCCPAKEQNQSCTSGRSTAFLLRSTAATADTTLFIAYSIKSLALFLVVFFFCFLIYASYPQPFFPLSSVAEALFVLSFSFLSERFFFVHAKPALVQSSCQK